VPGIHRPELLYSATIIMKYMVVWSIHEDNFNDSIERWATDNPKRLKESQ
jgi:hypothetical protein